MKRFYFSTILFAVLFLGTIQILCQQQTTYKGKAVSEWVADLNWKNPRETQNQAEAAIREIGTNAIPFLLGELRAISIIYRQNDTNRYPEISKRLVNARAALCALGPIAKPAVPDLVGLLSSRPLANVVAESLTYIDPQASVTIFTRALTNRDIAVRLAVSDNLFMVRSNAGMAVPLLLENLKFNSADTNAWMVRHFAAHALGFIGKNPARVVPALVGALQHDENSRVRRDAARALGMFGTNAVQAIPLLTLVSTNDPDTTVRRGAIWSINQIELSLGALMISVHPRTGDYAVVPPDREAVVFRNGPGDILWSTNIVKAVEKNPGISGERKINYLGLDKGEIIVHVGREVLSVDPGDGSVKDLGSN